jgi:formamidopyrimidine-DNA glycosylase
MEGARFVRVEQRRPDLRFPFPNNFNKRLEGQSVTGLGRRAKYLLADLSSGEVLLMHLGMSGSFRVVHGSDEDAPGKFHHVRGKLSAHDHVVFHMSNGAVITFNDPRRFGYMRLIAREQLNQDPMIEALGPEPLGNAFDGALLAQACAGKKTSLKAALSDQKVVAGLGNIYVCEALFRARLSPQRSAHTVPGARAERLVPAIKDTLTEAVAAGGSSLRDYVQPDGELGYFQHAWKVYGHEGEPCERCPGRPACTGIRRVTQSGRSSFYCPRTQR